VKKGVREFYFACETGEPNLKKIICENNKLFLSKKDKEPVSRDIEISCGEIIFFFNFKFIKIRRQVKSVHPLIITPIRSSSKKRKRKISILLAWQKLQKAHLPS